MPPIASLRRQAFSRSAPLLREPTAAARAGTRPIAPARVASTATLQGPLAPAPLPARSSTAAADAGAPQSSPASPRTRAPALVYRKSSYLLLSDSMVDLYLLACTRLVEQQPSAGSVGHDMAAYEQPPVLLPSAAAVTPRYVDDAYVVKGHHSTNWPEAAYLGTTADEQAPPYLVCTDSSSPTGTPPRCSADGPLAVESFDHRLHLVTLSQSQPSRTKLMSSAEVSASLVVLGEHLRLSFSCG